ncbi:Rz1-like lysis system protein LysC [Solimicrobium silvestre]|uniref:Rz1-like lysis system protein LysC n=1 Tax=Solimicrobium silvestre TaxID=2099400 RepID=UPI000CFAD144|nr:Rz1-like lysis system protein LysC [Solimicrobium silvestre]
MTIHSFKAGLTLLCLLLLCSCASAPPPPAQVNIIQNCPNLHRCTLLAANPTTNGALNLLLERTEAAWADCAAQVDMMVDCQEETNR